MFLYIYKRLAILPRVSQSLNSVIGLVKYGKIKSLYINVPDKIYEYIIRIYNYIFRIYIYIFMIYKYKSRFININPDLYIYIYLSYIYIFRIYTFSSFLPF